MAGRFMKRAISAFIAGTVAVTSLFSTSVTASAASKKYDTMQNDDKVSVGRVWDGTADTSWYDPDALKKNYYIYTPEQLAGVAELVNAVWGVQEDFEEMSINLMNDIYLNEISDWESWTTKPPVNNWAPIGKRHSDIIDFQFEGIFNGNGHTIYGMYSAGHEAHNGLFGAIEEGTVANLRIEKSVIELSNTGATSGTFVGTLVQGTLESCVAKDIIIKGKDVGACAVGGLIGNGGRLGHLTSWLIMTAIMSWGQSMEFQYGGSTVVLSTLDLFPAMIGTAQALMDKDFDGCIIDNCAVENLTIDIKRAEGQGGDDALCGGIAGSAYSFINNTYCANAKILNKTAKGSGLAVGAIKARDSSDSKRKSKTINTYYCNVTKSSGSKMTNIKGSKKVTEKELKSKAFVKKLGDYYKYNEGGTPVSKIIRDEAEVVVSMLDQTVKYRATLSWKPVSGAKDYTLYQKGSSGKYKAVKTVTGTEISLDNLKKDSTYNLLLRANLTNGKTKTIGSSEFKMKLTTVKDSSLVSYNGHHYKLFNDAMKWSEAKRVCEQRGGHLVTITSSGEQKLIEKMIAKGEKRNYWLGGKTVKSGVDQYTWITGEKMTYTNWETDDCRSWGSYKGRERYIEDCLYMINHSFGTIGKWDDINDEGYRALWAGYFDTGAFGFICEWDA